MTRALSRGRDVLGIAPVWKSDRQPCPCLQEDVILPGPKPSAKEGGEEEEQKRTAQFLQIYKTLQEKNRKSCPRPTRGMISYMKPTERNKETEASVGGQTAWPVAPAK
eukprot:GHVU01046506.1.p3 GENE.GHVU01046506.1~~GHVU01046506.1.p3  ORF type:complete len:108 (-),score=10.35 GHVU01046506.1:498-821(-)